MNEENNENIETEEKAETVEKHKDINIKVSGNTDFSGMFHERDSLTENNIVSEVSSSFLEYSMSVITDRALPDLRDGLKPVNRRILWSMYESAFGRNGWVWCE